MSRSLLALLLLLALVACPDASSQNDRPGTAIDPQDQAQLLLREVTSACGFQPRGSRAKPSELDVCMGLVLHLFGVSTDDDIAKEQITETFIGHMRGIGTLVRYANSTRGVCWATPGANVSAWACESLVTMSWEFLAVAFRYLALGTIAGDALSEEDRDATADENFEAVRRILEFELETHAESPLGGLFGTKLQELTRDFEVPLSPSSHARQLVYRLFSLSRSICHHANFIVWRDTHFLWLSDSLQQGEVVHTAWGPRERWDELGAGDAAARQPLAGGARDAPSFAFSAETGQRNDILVSLLQKLFDKTRPEGGELLVVEVGVFRAGLSKFLLEKLPFVRLLGVDPYVGVDGTFPGDFSQTLNPDDAFATASSVFSSYPGRAELAPQTSERAAVNVADGSVDAVFIDGCHLYSCVKQDLDLWLPKVRPGGLVAGHDFSPQWPGVVGAVHERRSGGRRVFLGQDWTYWWYVE